MNWQLQDAKNQFSAVVKQAQSQGAQAITVRGKEAAYVVSAKTWRELNHKQGSLRSFLQASPLADIPLPGKHNPDTGRPITL